MIKVGPVGQVSKGHVLDCNKKAFEKTLKAYDPLLYVVWNPKKLKGHGCWEIRRKSDLLAPVDVAELDSTKIILKLDYQEYNWVNSIMDCAFLNYDAFRKLREMDMWQYATTSEKLDEVIARKTRDKQEKLAQQREEDLRYMSKYFSKELREWREAIRSGANPYDIARHWDSVKEAE
jgi:hypothetical protein